MTQTARITQIGSLPHANQDSALAYSFQMDIPFLPQIPIRNRMEFMVPQSLDGFPGLRVESDGSALVDENLWSGKVKSLKDQLEKAYQNHKTHDSYEAFEPLPTSTSCWQPFLWELSERKSSVAKIQITGPLTVSWSLRLTDGTPSEKKEDLSELLFKFLLARSLAMVRKLKAQGVKPLFFIDEPGLFGLNRSFAKHLVGLEQLKIFIQTLKQEDVTVGLHCCSDTDWKNILKLPIDYLSIDTHLSLKNFLNSASPAELQTFYQQGKQIAFGLIPTRALAYDLSAKELLNELSDHLKPIFSDPKEILKKSLFTPACGLAFSTIEEAERCLGLLLEIKKCLH